MSDRFVRQIDPPSSDGKQLARRISDFLTIPNIILVGDPGAGKSFLFQQLAAAENATLQTARDFLNTPLGPSGATLFIDALDEKRAGRNDQTTIDEIVRQLFKAKASRVRLSCREHDWLGDTDLAAFRPYFAQTEGYVVLALEALREEEQIDILRGEGIFDTAGFLREAARRGLADFLINPQSLKMLAEAVQKKSWPKSRLQLFEDTTGLLLQEHNLSRVRSGAGKYSSTEVRPAAGSVSALRLISDVEGVSLVESEADAAFPSYRSIPFADPEIILAALGRRAFRALPDEKADYSHRVRAEYLGAGWLAQKVREGLPLARVRALTAIDGVPAPELRGMHAWLVLLLREFSAELIDADPFGVLIYGDARSLDLSQRIRLLGGLRKLADADPFFVAEERLPATIDVLCNKTLESHLRLIISDQNAPFGIRRLLLDALSMVSPIPGLRKDLAAIVASNIAPFGLKAPAVKAAIHLGCSAANDLVAIYYSLGDTPEDIRLRAYILAHLYVARFSPSDVAALYYSAKASESDLASGILWDLSFGLPVADIPEILDLISAKPKGDDNADHFKDYEVEHFLERLIIRALEEGSSELSGARIFRWLQERRSLRGAYDEHEFAKFKELAVVQKVVAHRVFLEAVQHFSCEEGVGKMSRFVQSHFALDVSREPLNWLAQHLLSSKDRNLDSTKSLFALAMTWLVGDVNSEEVFLQLYQLGEEVPSLLSIRDERLSVAIDSWQSHNHKRAADRVLAKEASRLENRRRFEEDSDAVLRGEHVGWMVWLGNVYFAHFSDVDKNQTAMERIEVQLGKENSITAAAGLRTLALTGALPSLEELVSADEHNKYPTIWNAFAAGLDEVWLESGSVSDFDDERLKSLVGIDLVFPANLSDAQQQARKDGWKGHLLMRRPELVKDVYAFVAESALKRGKSHTTGLHALLNDDAFVQFRGGIALKFLYDLPDIPVHQLESLLQLAIVDSDRNELLELIGSKLHAASLSDEQRQLWALSAYLLDPDSFEAEFTRLAESSSKVVWRMRSLTSYDRDHKSRRSFSMQPSQVMLFAKIVAKHFEKSGYPSGGWAGDENPWDASDYVRNLLATLAADTSPIAEHSLKALHIDADMTSYRDDVKHAIARRAARTREILFKQPGWLDAISSLRGERPANVADMQALVASYIGEISCRMGTSNMDVYKSFWNEDSSGRPTSPKVEESARDALLVLLKPRLESLGLILEPEGHMVADKRADITVASHGLKLILELKRDIHPELWTAPKTQLNRFYTRDPEASGYGIFCVFWYGVNRKGKVPKRKIGGEPPKSAEDLQRMLNEEISADGMNKLVAVVVDVGVPDGQSIFKAKKAPRRGVAKPTGIIKRKKSTRKNVRSTLERSSKNSRSVARRKGH